MSNFETVIGGIGWALVSLLLVFAALEPVSIDSGAPTLQMAGAAHARQQPAAA